MSDPIPQPPSGTPRPAAGGVPASATGDLHSLRRSVRANTEVANPPENFKPPAPGEAVLYPTAPATGSIAQVPTGTDETAETDTTVADDGADRRSPGTRILGGVLAWIPRALLLVTLFQLVRLIPGLPPLPDLSRSDPFRMIGDGVLALAGLDPGWSDQAANLTIPVLGLMLVLAGNYLTPLWRGHRLHLWPYLVAILAWIGVFAGGDLNLFRTQ